MDKSGQSNSFQIHSLQLLPRQKAHVFLKPICSAMIQCFYVFFNYNFCYNMLRNVQRKLLLSRCCTDGETKINNSTFPVPTCNTSIFNSPLYQPSTDSLRQRGPNVMFIFDSSFYKNGIHNRYSHYLENP